MGRETKGKIPLEQGEPHTLKTGRCALDASCGHLASHCEHFEYTQALEALQLEPWTFTQAYEYV